MLKRLVGRLVLGFVALGAALIFASSLVYANFDELPPFVIEKLPLRFETLWMTSLRIHVATAVVTLPLCTLLMTRFIQRRATIHRWLGRLAGLLMVFLVPSGAVLAFSAKGGAVVTAGFLLSAALVAWFMVKGVASARRRDLVTHRRAMLHVFTQMSVAVTSRAMLIGLDYTGISPETAYVVALWVPVLGSILVTESLSRSMSVYARAFGRIGHVVRSLVRSLRVSRSRSLARVGR